MKIYQKPEAEMVIFATESITVDGEIGTGESFGNERE